MLNRMSGGRLEWVRNRPFRRFPTVMARSSACRGPGRAYEDAPCGDEEDERERREYQPVRTGRRVARVAVGRQQGPTERRRAVSENPTSADVVADRLESPAR